MSYPGSPGFFGMFKLAMEDWRGVRMLSVWSKSVLSFSDGERPYNSCKSNIAYIVFSAGQFKEYVANEHYVQIYIYINGVKTLIKSKY